MIRPIRMDDIPACVTLYNRYITETTVTFELQPLTGNSLPTVSAASHADIRILSMRMRKADA